LGHIFHIEEFVSCEYKSGINTDSFSKICISLYVCGFVVLVNVRCKKRWR